MKILASAAVTLALLSGTAYAADAPLVVVDEEAVAFAISGWDGFYLGVGVIAETAAPPSPADTIVGLQGIAGFNATFDSVLLGGEVYIMPGWSTASGFGWGVGALGRLGVLVTDSALLYGAVGLEWQSNNTTWTSVGGGVEFIVSEDLSLDLEYKYYLENGGGGGRYHHVGLSANWQF